MNKQIHQYLKSFSDNPTSVDKLIVSAFLEVNELELTNNQWLASYLILKKDEQDWKNLTAFVTILKKEIDLFDIEKLIELFEFVVSPEDKIVTGAVYTPVEIRKYIVEQCLSKVENLNNVTICDPACGCSGFLYTTAQIIKERTNRTYAEIFRENLFGLDIQEYSVTRSKLLLTLFALSEGEDQESFEFNLYNGNALNFNWANHVQNFQGFQVIVGNPPYVCSRNMDEETLALLTNWSVTKSGHPDLYIPFFQIGYECLAEQGVLGFITVNTFIKSINGRALRSYFADNQVSLKIINFGGEQVFKDKNTYTCLCFLQKSEGSILYKRTHSAVLKDLTPDSFFAYDYTSLNHNDGWNLVDSHDKNEFINKIEAIGKPFKDLFTTRNGIATLKNNVYKFNPAREDADYYYLVKDDVEYPIERAICRNIVNANKIKTTRHLTTKEEKIIFPYEQANGEVTILPERTFRQTYPNAYYYLGQQRVELAGRDKGKKEYEAWYAYGRRQSMDAYTYKLFFPHICERPTFVISRDPELLFYNGIAVVSDSLQELVELKSLLESDIFFEYIKSTTKDYSSGYISLSRNYLKNFGVPQLTRDERRLLRSREIEQNIFWENIYEHAFTEITPVPELV